MRSTAVIVDQLPSSSGWLSDAALRKKLQEVSTTIESLTSQRPFHGGKTESEMGKAVGVVVPCKKGGTLEELQWWGNTARNAGNVVGQGNGKYVTERVAGIQEALQTLQGLIIQTNSSSSLRSTVREDGGRSIGSSTAVMSSMKASGIPRVADSKHTKGGRTSHWDPTSLCPSHPKDEQSTLVSYADISLRLGFRDLVVPCFKDPLLRCLEFPMGNIQQLAVGVLIAFFQCARNGTLVESLSHTFAAPLLHLTGSGKASLRQAATTAVVTLFSFHVGKGALSEALRVAGHATHPRVRGAAFQALLHTLRQRYATPWCQSLSTFLPRLVQVVQDGLTKEPHPLVRAGAARLFWGLCVVDASAAHHLLQCSPFFSGVRERNAVLSRLLTERAAALEVLGVVLSPSPFSRLNGKPSGTVSSSSMVWPPRDGKKKGSTAQETEHERWSSLLCFLQDASLHKTCTLDGSPRRVISGIHDDHLRGTAVPSKSKRDTTPGRRRKGGAPPAHGRRQCAATAEAEDISGHEKRGSREERKVTAVLARRRRSTADRETDHAPAAAARQRSGRRKDRQRSWKHDVQKEEERHRSPKTSGPEERRNVQRKSSSFSLTGGAVRRPCGGHPESKVSSLSRSSSSSLRFSSSSSSSDASSLAQQEVRLSSCSPPPPPPPLCATPPVNLDGLTTFWYPLPYSPPVPPSNAVRQALQGSMTGTTIDRGWTGRGRFCFRSALSPQYEGVPYRIAASYQDYSRAILQKQRLSLVLMRREGTTPDVGSAAIPFPAWTRNDPRYPPLHSSRNHDEEVESGEKRYHRERALVREGQEKHGWGVKEGKDKDGMREVENDSEMGIVVASVLLWKAYIRHSVLPHREDECGVTAHARQREREEGKEEVRLLRGEEERYRPRRWFPASASFSSFFFFACSTVKELLQQDVDALQWLTPSLRYSTTHRACPVPTGVVSPFAPLHPKGGTTPFSPACSLLAPMEDFFLLPAGASCAGTTPATSHRLALLERVQQHVMLLALLLHMVVLSPAFPDDQKSAVPLWWPKRFVEPQRSSCRSAGIAVQEGHLFSKKALNGAPEAEEEEEEENDEREERQVKERTPRQEGKAHHAALGRVGRRCGDKSSGSGGGPHARCAACSCSRLPSSDDRQYHGMEWETTMQESEEEEEERNFGSAADDMLSPRASGSLPRRRSGGQGRSARRKVSFSPLTTHFSRKRVQRPKREAMEKAEAYPYGDGGSTTPHATRLQEREGKEFLHKSLANVLSRVVHRLRAWAQEEQEPYAAVRRMAMKVLQSVLLASCSRTIPSFSFPLRLNALCGPIIRTCQSGMDDSSEEVRQTALECLYSLLFAPSVPLDTSLDGLSACLEHWFTSPAGYSSTAGYRELLLCVGRLLEWERRRQDHSSPDYRPSPQDSLLPRLNHPFTPSSLSPLSTCSAVVTLTQPVVRRLVVALQRLLVYYPVEKIQQMSATVLILLQWVVSEAREIMEEVLNVSQLQKLSNWADACDSWPEMW